jgi:hypothetical protein
MAGRAKRGWGAVGVAAAVASTVLVTAPASAATPEEVTAIVSAAPGLANANGAVGQVEMARDGRFVAFTSKATNLVPGTTAGVERVYLRDLWSDTTVLVSRTQAGAANEASAAHLGAITPDGSHVVFSTSTAMVPSDTNGVSDIYLWTRATRTVALVSTTWNGALANGDSGIANGDVKADLSDDARYVFFSSIATNLTSATDSNGEPDIFRKDRTTGAVARISLNGAAQLNGASYQVDASANGRHVVWATSATNLPGTDTNGAADIWYRDLNDLTIQKVSVGLDANANGSSLYPTISDDGDRVVFQSSATDLVNNDTNGNPDVFFRQRSTSFTNRLSTGSAGAQLPNGGTSPDMTPDGQVFAFVTASAALPTDTNGRSDVYTRQAGINRLESLRSGGTQLAQNVSNASIGDDHVAWTTTDASATTDTNNLNDAFVRSTPFLSTFETVPAYVNHTLTRFTGSAPAAVAGPTVTRIRAGAAAYTWTVSLADAPAFADKRAPVIRLYWAYFKRRPDLGGLNFWINRYRNGARLVDISQEFAKSSEFRNKYGNTTPEQFVTLVYQNVLERNPESGGLAYWAKKIRTGTPRGQVMTNFSESSEGRRVIGPRSDTILLALGMYGKIPSQALFDAIVDARKSGEPKEIAVPYILGAPEYIATL